MPRILITEDDDLIRRGIVSFLKGKGYECREAGSGKECLELISDEIDLLVLDVNLPDDNGFEICRTLRKSAYKLPVLFLTVNDEESSVINGFDSGADDYVTKPFSLAVLLKRIEALLSRGDRKSSRSEYVYGCFRMDRQSGDFFIGDNHLILSRVEVEIMNVLLENKNRVVSRDRLIARVWDSRDEYVDQRTLDVNISRLRKKIKASGVSEKVIATVFGLGYKWDESEID